MNFTTTHIRSEKVTVDTRIYTVLGGARSPARSTSLQSLPTWS